MPAQSIKDDCMQGGLRAGRLVRFCLCGLLSGLPMLAGAQVTAIPTLTAQTNIDSDLQQQAAQLPGTVSGTVVDSDGDAIVGAQITLSGDGLAIQRTAVADGDGYFSFLEVPAGSFDLTVAYSGFETAVKSVMVHAGEDFESPDVVLPVGSAKTVVEVSPASQYAMAEADLHTEETQRLVGLLPNFYVTYNWNAPPMTSGQKFRLGFRSVIDPANFALAGIIAGIEQGTNAYSGYGQGAQGYGKRYGAALADNTVGNMLGGAVFPSLLRQDPRYFYKGTGSVMSRALYAISTAVICKGDNGKWQPNYSSVLGDISAGAVSNLYYPASDRSGALLTIENGLLNAAEDGIGNLLQEFVFKRITPGSRTSP